MSSPAWPDAGDINILDINTKLAELVSFDGKRVVDVGSGDGGRVRFMIEHGADAVGVECGATQLERAVTADPEHLERYLDGVGQDLPIDDASADVVTFCYSLHHVPEAEILNALREAHRVLRPGGTLLVMEPIAAGPGHEVDKLVDDETHVRALAQAALQEAPQIGFTLDSHHSFFSEWFYADFAAYEADMVGSDESRTARMIEHRDAASEAFHRYATREDRGFSFAQENDVKIYRKS